MAGNANSRATRLNLSSPRVWARASQHKLKCIAQHLWDSLEAVQAEPGGSAQARAPAPLLLLQLRQQPGARKFPIAPHRRPRNA